jgi:hypothetical protein
MKIHFGFGLSSSVKYDCRLGVSTTWTSTEEIGFDESIIRLWTLLIAQPIVSDADQDNAATGDTNSSYLTRIIKISATDIPRSLLGFQSIKR